MKLFFTKIPFLLLFIFSTFLSSANNQDSLSVNELAHIQSKIDSIEMTIVDQQMKLKKLDQKFTTLDTSLNKNKNRISITDLLVILISCLTLIDNVIANRIRLSKIRRC